MRGDGAVTTTDWNARAEREAGAILSECGYSGNDGHIAYDRLVSLLGIAWLQGSIYGSHETLGDAERAFEKARAEL